MDSHKNFASSAVVTAPSPAISGDTIQVVQGEGDLFPLVPFNAVLAPQGTRPKQSNAEIVRVIDREGDVLTIERAQESTEAKEIGEGWQIAAAITVKTITDIETALASVSVPVTSVFGRTGDVALLSADVTSALGFTPYNATNPSGYLSAITHAQVVTALGSAWAIDSTTARTTINVSSTTGGNVEFGGNKPATVTASPATPGSTNGRIYLAATDGGDISLASGSATGGVGGTITLLTGKGGSPLAATANTTGGAGGLLVLQGGNGGDSSVAGVSSTAGGAGGGITLIGGNGGVGSTGSAIKRGAAGGPIIIQSGNGGLSAAGANGGAGGNFTLAPGTGGASTVNSGGAAGSILGIGSTGGAGSLNGGHGSDINFAGGTGGAGTTGIGGAGGQLALSSGIGGAATTGGQGGSLDITANSGGNGTTGNGGAGGSATITAGSGGVSTSGGNGGAAGDISLLAGASGTGGTRPVGGNIYAFPGVGLTDGNVCLAVSVSNTARGFVGIRKNNPAVALDVNGDILASATIKGRLTTDNAYTATPPTCTGFVTIYDSTGTAYKVLVAA